MDLLEHYRWAVQDPETHAEVLNMMHAHAGPPRPAAMLREDFAGTSADSVAWVALERPGTPRRAVAIDRSGPTLAWAYRRAQRILGERSGRVRLVQRDVLAAADKSIPKADIIAALNFSALYLHDEPAMLEYLRAARTGLAKHGVLVFNLFGGTEAISPGVRRHRVVPVPRLARERAIAPFDYLWEVRGFDAVRGCADCRVHFEVPDAGAPTGVRRVDDAFRYDFRVWSPGPLMRLCREAGFADARLWRHTYDPARGESGVFLGPVETGSVEGLSSWTGYVVARG